MKNLKLNNGVEMPILGFGTWQANDEELEKAVEAALEAGYRHIDTAYVYENEPVIGRVLSRWLNAGKLKRNELFIVTKLPPGGNRPKTVEKYLRKSLNSLQLDYVDQYLIHTPFTFVEKEEDAHPRNEKGEMLLEYDTDLVAIWKEMEKLVDAGLTRSIGVSNFNIRQIERILKSARIPPATLQVELHLYFQQNELVDFCNKNKISVVAYSPLGSKGLGKLFSKFGLNRQIPDLMDNPIVIEIATKHKKTPAQVMLRFTIERGIVAIPKSTNPERIKQNIQVFDFHLDDDDSKKLRALDKGPAARLCDFIFLTGTEKHPEYPF